MGLKLASATVDAKVYIHELKYSGKVIKMNSFISFGS